MESNQLNNTSGEDNVIELLTLTCEVDKYGNKIYRNKEGLLHRIYGPAYICAGLEVWYKNGKRHRTDGPAIIWKTGDRYYYINDERLSRRQFIQWQKDIGITPIK